MVLLESALGCLPGRQQGFPLFYPALPSVTRRRLFPRGGGNRVPCVSRKAVLMETTAAPRRAVSVTAMR